MSRSAATSTMVTLFMGLSVLAFVGLVPVIWHQGASLVKAMPEMFSGFEVYLAELPQKYPEVLRHINLEQVTEQLRQRAVSLGQNIVSASVSSLVDLVVLLVYAILVPLMMFFFLKDRDELMASLTRFLPKDSRTLVDQVSTEMNVQIMNYIRGKIIEILIIGVTSYIAFALLGLEYAALLGLLVGLSVLVPYIGATVVTFPVMFVALFQWGISPEFGYVMLAYGIIQALDGNLLVPILFSEAVNLHPVFIILAVIIFGGLWGFWGVFFAIPLATLVKAVLNAWPNNEAATE